MLMLKKTPLHSFVLLLTVLVLFSSCQNYQRNPSTYGGLTAGTALGAGLGAIVGNQVGDTGAGVAIGSAFGAVSGALVGSQLDGQNNAISANDSAIYQQQRQIDENRRLINDLRRRGVDAVNVDRGVMVNLPDVYFAFDSSQLSYKARSVVRDIARLSGRRKISVEGHADSTGTRDYNYRLSLNRAQRVARELDNNGVPSDLIFVQGFGEDKPIASNKNSIGRQKNRRVEVILLDATPRR